MSCQMGHSNSVTHDGLWDMPCQSPPLEEHEGQHVAVSVGSSPRRTVDTKAQGPSLVGDA